MIPICANSLESLGMCRWPDPSHSQAEEVDPVQRQKLAANSNDWMNPAGGSYIKKELEKKNFKKNYWKTTGRCKLKEQSTLENKLPGQQQKKSS